MNRIKHILLLISIGLIFITCKKYPENTLWFKNIKKISPFYGHLNKYMVNGIDSLNLLNNYFSANNKVGLIKNIQLADFFTTFYSGNRHDQILNFTGAASIGLSYEYVKKNKYIKLVMGKDTSVFKKNLFIDSEVEWQILQLGKNPFKAKTTLENGNIYEIEIGN